jgi:hypothetical protein
VLMVSVRVTLRRCLSNVLLEGRLCPMTLCREAFVPSHVLYADDIIISCKGTKNNIRCVLSNFNDYGAASGQTITKTKSRKHMRLRHQLICSSECDDVNIVTDIFGHFDYVEYRFMV